MITADIFAIMQDAGGAHEPDCVLSLWSTYAGAVSELGRLHAQTTEASRVFGNYHIVPVTLDTPSDLWIGAT